MEDLNSQTLTENSTVKRVKECNSDEIGLSDSNNEPHYIKSTSEENESLYSDTRLNDNEGDHPVAESENMLQTISYRQPLEAIYSQSEDINNKSEEDEESQDRLLILDDELAAPTPVTLTDDEIASEIDFTNNKSEIVVTVKFRIASNETMTSAFTIDSKILEVKERLAKMLKVNSCDLRLYHEGAECDDLVPLSGLGVEPLGAIELGIRPTDPSRVLAPVEFSRYMPIVDVITVRVPLDAGGFKEVVVEIENQCFTKTWLGGYRHRITKVEYYHAQVQTLPRKRPLNNLPLNSRNTQTPSFPFKDAGVGTRPSKGTQMRPTDLYLPNVNDSIVLTDSSRFVPKKETTNMPLLVAVVTRVQRYRRRFAERHKIKMQKERDRKHQEKRRRVKEYREKLAVEADKKVAVGSAFSIERADFYLLYLLIGKWWRREMAKIANTKSEESRKAGLLDLLNREVALISVVEQQRIEAKKQISLKRDMQLLEAVARPIIFRDSKGNMSSVDTLATQQAREYKEMIRSFLNLNVSKERRIEVLCTVKHQIDRYRLRYEHAQEIVNLLQRECQLLALGVDDQHLKSLRDRATQLLFYFLHKYIVNSSSSFSRPGAVKTDGSLHHCLHCRKLKPISEFNTDIKMTSLTTCRSCECMRNIGLERNDLTPYAKLLGQVRQTEMQNGCYSSVCYVLQVVGMYYLIRHIWYCKSILSGAKDLNDLRSERFRKNEGWSPWNCILLTAKEAAAHLDIENVYKFYSRQFLDKVRWRHLRAKRHFMPLLLNDRRMRESKLWDEGTDHFE